MTRFIYLADSHIGANPMGYHQQNAYPEHMDEIAAALIRQIELLGQIDFVLHGGDMVDFTSKDNISAASRVFDVGVPVYLCLGNHDLTSEDAVETWLKCAPHFFPGHTPDFSVQMPECTIHVLPNQWCDTPFFWKDSQSPCFSAGQNTWLSNRLSSSRGVPQVILTHSPVLGIPQEQTGFSEPFHAPPASFCDQVQAICDGCRDVRCVLGAHNHINMRVNLGGVEFVTVSALAEFPFEIKLLEFSSETFSMLTISLQTSHSRNFEYDAGRTYVQGSDAHRNFTTSL